MNSGTPGCGAAKIQHSRHMASMGGGSSHCFGFGGRIGALAECDGGEIRGQATGFRSVKRNARNRLAQFGDQRIRGVMRPYSSTKVTYGMFQRGLPYPP